MQAMNSYGRVPMMNNNMNLQRAHSVNVMGNYQRPPPHMMGGPFNGAMGPNPMMYGAPRPPMGAQAMPYGFSQAAPMPRPAPAPVSPMWESAHASRSHIVFQGEGTVFCVKLASPKDQTASIQEIKL